MNREITLIRKRYCADRKIKDEQSVTLDLQQVNNKTGNSVFLVYRAGQVPEMYEHPREDLTPYTNYRGLDVPADMKADYNSLKSKDCISTWINRRVTLDILPEDIGILLVKTDVVAVVIASNSMRFKNSFTISFQ